MAKSLLFFNLSLLLAATLAGASYEEFQFELYSHSLPIPGSFAPTHTPTSAPAPAPAPKHHHHHHRHQPSLAPAHPPSHAPAHHPVLPPAHHPVLPPVHPPAHHPVLPPVHPPAKAPAMPPHSMPPRKFIGVQGVVYCKHCKYIGVNTVWKAKPLQGAVVRLTCNNTKYRPVVAEAATDINGYFLILAKNVTNAAFHKCKVAMVKSSSPKCNNPTDFKGGLKGAMLIPSKEPVPKTWPANYQAFNVGPFAYEPSKKLNCTSSS